MNGIYSCLIAISMYSRLPVPQVEWTDERMRHVMCFFPVVGVIEGLCLGGWFLLADRIWKLSLTATVLWGAAIPLLVTGGIHMDGFMDTMDALCSYGDREKKLQILKDPHLGAFAVISAITYMLLYTGALYEFGPKPATRTRSPTILITQAMDTVTNGVLESPIPRNTAPRRL